MSLGPCPRYSVQPAELVHRRGGRGGAERGVSVWRDDVGHDPVDGGRAPGAVARRVVPDADEGPLDRLVDFVWCEVDGRLWSDDRVEGVPDCDESGLVAVAAVEQQIRDEPDSDSGCAGSPLCGRSVC